MIAILPINFCKRFCFNSVCLTAVIINTQLDTSFFLCIVYCLEETSSQILICSRREMATILSMRWKTITSLTDVKQYGLSWRFLSMSVSSYCLCSVSSRDGMKSYHQKCIECWLIDKSFFSSRCYRFVVIMSSMVDI